MFHLTDFTLQLDVIPDWNPRNTNAMTGKMTSFWIVFPPIKAKTSKPSFRWLAAFIPSWNRRGRGKQVQERRVWERLPHSSSLQPTPCHAFCIMLPTDQKWGYREPLGYFDTSFFVSVPGNKVSCFYSWGSGRAWTFSESVLVDNQRGKTDFATSLICNIEMCSWRELEKKRIDQRPGFPLIDADKTWYWQLQRAILRLFKHKLIMGISRLLKISRS